MDTPLFEMRGITKKFPPATLALNRVDFSAKRGEIQCLLGENGAGKTTLMNILYGLYTADEGEIFFEDMSVKIRSPRDAMRLGIGMVHQHFLQIQQHTVAENIALGLSTKSALSPLKEIRELIRNISDQYGLTINPDAKVWQLSAGEQQRVEIIKVLCRNVKVLILDEPTSILTPQETNTLFRALRNIVDENKTIIFITHKLDEVMALSDRVSVLRRGHMVATLDTKDTTKRQLAKMMVGREVLFQLEKKPFRIGRVVLKVERLNAFDDMGFLALKEVSFKVREGEILGVAGIAGNGQEELIEVLTGIREASSGSVYLLGEDVTKHTCLAIAERGVAHIPEKRVTWGIVPDMCVADNLILRDFRKSPYSKGIFINRDEIRKHAERLVQDYDIVTPGVDASAKILSGGNIQRLILARELSKSPRIIIAAHPTYGLDVGATEQIRRLILDQRQRGSAVLLVSEDLDEIFILSNRIAVMFEGRIQKVIETDEAKIDEIGFLMSGVREAEE